MSARPSIGAAAAALLLSGHACFRISVALESGTEEEEEAKDKSVRNCSSGEREVVLVVVIFLIAEEKLLF